MRDDVTLSSRIPLAESIPRMIHVVARELELYSIGFLDANGLQCYYDIGR